MYDSNNHADIDILSWNEIDKLSRQLAAKIPSKPDVIVAVMRGGAVVSSILANELEVEEVASIKVVQGCQVPDQPMKSIILVPLNQWNFEDKNVLIVDDILDSGETLLKVREVMGKLKTKSLKVAVLHKKIYSRFEPDYYVEVRANWIFYPWMSRKELDEMRRIIASANL